MATPVRPATSFFRARLGMFVFATAIVYSVIMVTTQPAWGQSFTVLYAFTGEHDGAYPENGLTLNRGGNLYGTATSEGDPQCRCGTVYELSRGGSSWTFTLLHTFQGTYHNTDGDGPFGEVMIGADGSLYGVTEFGGSPDHCSGGCGTIYNLRPPTNAFTPEWNETVLYRFLGGADGAYPSGPLTRDGEGSLYASAAGGGIGANGAIVKLTPAGGSWTESVVYAFTEFAEPEGGVVFDQAGSLYGAASGSDQIFQLTPSGAGWTEHVLHTFTGSDGAGVWGELIFDRLGNLYGTTWKGGAYDEGTVFRLSPSGGGWSYELLFSFGPSIGAGFGPASGLAMDDAGNLYGTTESDGIYGYGAVYKLSALNDGWHYTSLHDFTGGLDGSTPIGRVTLDPSGNIFGTTLVGGSGMGQRCGERGCGVIWEITP